MEICVTCKQEQVYSANECVACYKYRNRTGKTRPRHLWRPFGKFCSNCHRAKVWVKGMCPACHKYKHKHGINRPKHLYESNPSCANCGKHDKLRVSSGLCDRCSQFFRLTGDMMPRRYWSAKRWCDCGNAATEKVALRVGRRKHEYWLCVECKQLETGGRTKTGN